MSNYQRYHTNQKYQQWKIVVVIFILLYNSKKCLWICPCIWATWKCDAHIFQVPFYLYLGLVIVTVDTQKLPEKKSVFIRQIPTPCCTTQSYSTGFFCPLCEKLRSEKKSDRGHNSGQNHPKTQISGYHLLDFLTLY